MNMANEIIKYELQFEEIRGIITMHRERALRSVNEEETAQMNKYAIVQAKTAQLLFSMCLQRTTQEQGTFSRYA